MNCEHFRSLIERYRPNPLPSEVWDTPEGEAWNAHRLSCEACLDECLRFDLVQRGLSPGDFPCVHAGHLSTCECEQFRDLGRCDNLTLWREPGGEFCIAARDGDLWGVKFCPQCGVRWPEQSGAGWMKRPLPTKAALGSLELPVDLRAFLLAPPEWLDVSMPRSRVLVDERWLSRMRRIVTRGGTIPFLVDPQPSRLVLYCFELESGTVVMFNDDEEEVERWSSFAQWSAHVASDLTCDRAAGAPRE